MIKTQTIVIGANSQIAQAIIQQLMQAPEREIITISRQTDSSKQSLSNGSEYPSRVEMLSIEDYSPQSIKDAIKNIENKCKYAISQVFICCGVLHSKNISPEKRIEDFNLEEFNQVITANAITPLLWLQALFPLIKSNTPCKIIVFSARVGSIGDNRLGGWYSYRASKSALNMLLKNTAIEFSRRAKNTKLIAFHPGTTDTPLSKPFQANVPEEKLFTPNFVAGRLLSLIEEIEIDGELSYLDWEGKTIQW